MKQLCTIITPDIADHCRELDANHAEYAAANNYFYKSSSSLHWPDLPASFSKVWTCLEALRNGCETVIWADIDVAFMNMRYDLEQLVVAPEYWIAGYNQKNQEFIGDRPYLCAGLMVIKNGIETIRFFEKWAQLIDTREVTWHPWDQWWFDQLLRDRNFAGCRLCGPSEIGSFSKELWNDGYPWQPGYPTVHLTTPLDWPKRRKVFLDHYQGIVKR